MNQPDMFERLLASLHEAVLDDAHWPATSALIDDLCGSSSNSLVCGAGCSTDDNRILFAMSCWRGQQNEEWVRQYFEEYHARDERVPRFRQLPESRVVHVTEIYTEEELKISATYNEILRLTNKQNSLNVRLNGPHGWRIALDFGGRVDGDGWSSNQVETVERLLPHLRQFVCVRQALVDARALGASLGELLANVRVGVIHLDLRGSVVAANDRARAILRRSDGLTDRGGMLRAALPNEDAELQKVLARALPISGETGAGGSTMVSREHSAVRLVLHVSPVKEGAAQVGVSRVGALVLVVDPDSRSRIDAERVGAILGLSPAESRVAAMLAEGKTIRDIAVATGRSPTTVKWHVGNIFAKVGVSRQADLVRLVLSLGDISGV